MINSALRKLALSVVLTWVFGMMGCATTTYTDTSPTLKKVQQERTINYNTPEENYKLADTNIITGGFLEDYAGSYIKFTGKWIFTNTQGSDKFAEGFPKEICAVYITSETDQKVMYTKFLCSDKALVRPIVGVKNADRDTIRGQAAYWDTIRGQAAY